MSAIRNTLLASLTLVLAFNIPSFGSVIYDASYGQSAIRKGPGFLASRPGAGVAGDVRGISTGFDFMSAWSDFRLIPQLNGARPTGLGVKHFFSALLREEETDSDGSSRDVVDSGLTGNLVSAVPEPVSLALGAIGLLLIVVSRVWMRWKSGN